MFPSKISTHLGVECVRQIVVRKHPSKTVVKPPSPGVLGIWMLKSILPRQRLVIELTMPPEVLGLPQIYAVSRG